MSFRPEPGASPARFSPSATLAWLVLLGALFAGCGRSAAPQTTVGTPAPAAAELAEDTKGASKTLEQAEAELEQARAELAQLGIDTPASGPAVGAAPSPAPQASESKAQAADEAMPKRRSAEATVQRKSEGFANRDDACETTCKAYSSLLRAKAAVCRLDVPNGARCARAETIVREASAQVQSCQCAPGGTGD
jgi:hypothetical protein